LIVQKQLNYNFFKLKTYYILIIKSINFSSEKTLLKHACPSFQWAAACPILLNSGQRSIIGL
jgi:hypothetical protein